MEEDAFSLLESLLLSLSDVLCELLLALPELEEDVPEELLSEEEEDVPPEEVPDEEELLLDELEADSTLPLTVMLSALLATAQSLYTTTA